MFWKWKLLLGLVLFKLQSFKFSFKQFGMHLTTTWDAFHSPNAKRCLIYLPDINLWGVLKGNFVASFLAYDHALHIHPVHLTKKPGKTWSQPLNREKEKTWTPTTKLKTKFINLWCIPNLKVAWEEKQPGLLGACLYYPLHHRHLLVTIFGLA